MTKTKKITYEQVLDKISSVEYKIICTERISEDPYEPNYYMDKIDYIDGCDKNTR